MKYLYRLYQLLIAAPILLLLTFVTSVVTYVGCSLGDARFWAYWPAMLWSRAMCVILLLPVEVSGRENIKKGTSYIIAPNHQGAFDIFLIYGYLGFSFRWMMKFQLRSIPFVGKACEAAGHIMVYNRGAKAIAKTMAQTEDALRSGASIVAFPEAERTLTGRINPFKRGIFVLAEESGIPIVPAIIRGSYEVLPRQRGFWFVEWHPISLTLLPVIDVKGKTADQLRDETYEVITKAY